MNSLINLFFNNKSEKKYSTHKVIQNSDLVENLIINTADKYLVSIKNLDPTYTEFQKMKTLNNNIYFNINEIKDNLEKLILKVNIEDFFQLSNYNFSIFSRFASIYGVVSNISNLIKYNDVKSSKNGNIILLRLTKKYYIIKCIENVRSEVFEIELFDKSINKLEIKDFVWHSVFNNVLLCFDNDFLICFELNESLKLITKTKLNGIIRARYSTDGK